MRNLIRMSALSATALALAACGQTDTYVKADPVVNGVRFPNRVIPLGPVDIKIRVDGKQTRHVQQYFFVPVESAVVDPVPDSLGVVIAFIARTDSVKLKLRSGTFYFGDRKTPAHPVAVYSMMGDGKSCWLPLDRNAGQTVWFDSSISSVSWTCRYIKFSVPGHQAYDRLELVLDQLEINDALVDVQPINFVLHAEDSFSSH